jgi:hypothetical protein
MNNSKWPRQRRPKKRARHGPGKRNRPGNRSALSSSGGCRTGFRGPGDGGATPSFVTRRACSGTTPERRHQQSCGAAITLLLRWLGRLSWPSQQDFGRRAGTSAFGAGLLPLCPMQKWMLSARPSSEVGIVFVHAWRSAHDGQSGSTRELRREQRVIARVGGSGSQCQAGLQKR